MFKIRFSENAFCAYRRKYDVKTGSQKRTLKKEHYSSKTAKLQNGFGAETTLCMYFTVLENANIQKEQK